jgi:hypothetical protein
MSKLGRMPNNPWGFYSAMDMFGGVLAPLVKGNNFTAPCDVRETFSPRLRQGMYSFKTLMHPAFLASGVNEVYVLYCWRCYIRIRGFTVNLSWLWDNIPPLRFIVAHLAMARVGVWAFKMWNIQYSVFFNNRNVNNPKDFCLFRLFPACDRPKILGFHYNLTYIEIAKANVSAIR